MATLERLLIRIEADTRELRAQMQGAGAIVEGETRKIERSWDGVDRAVRVVRNQIAGVLGAYVGIRAVIGFVGDLAERATERHAELAGQVSAIGENWESIQSNLADLLAGPLAGMLGWADEFIGRLAAGAEALKRLRDDLADVPNRENRAEIEVALAQARRELAVMEADLAAGADLSRSIVEDQRARVAELEAALAAMNKTLSLMGGMGLPPLPFEKPFHEAPAPKTGSKPRAPDIVLAPGGATRMEQILAGSAEARAELAKMKAEAQEFLDDVTEAMLAATGQQEAILERAADARLDELRRLRDEGLITEREWADGVREVHQTLFAELDALERERTEAERQAAEERARIAREQAEELRQLFAGTTGEIRRQFETMQFSISGILRAIASDLAASLVEFGLGNIFGSASGPGLLGSLLGGLGIPGFAAGGPIRAGQPAIVGEAGPELFVPRVPGMIVPNGAVASGGSSVVINQQFVLNPGADQLTVAALHRTARAIKDAAVAEVQYAQRRSFGAFLGA